MDSKLDAMGGRARLYICVQPRKLRQCKPPEVEYLSNQIVLLDDKSCVKTRGSAISVRILRLVMRLTVRVQLVQIIPQDVHHILVCFFHFVQTHLGRQGPHEPLSAFFVCIICQSTKPICDLKDRLHNIDTVTNAAAAPHYAANQTILPGGKPEYAVARCHGEQLSTKR